MTEALHLTPGRMGLCSKSSMGPNRTALDLNMGCCHIKLSDASKELCTIAAQWGKCERQRLPMGSCNSPDIFQEEMNDLLDGPGTARVCIDGILHVTTGSLEDHSEGLKKSFAAFDRQDQKSTPRNLTSAHTKPAFNLSQRRSKHIKQSKCPKPVNNYKVLLA
jgi:hypothetical protein